MIEQFVIFSRGGTVLWCNDQEGSELDMSAVDSLVRNVFLGDRSAESSFKFVFDHVAYLLKWLFNNELGLIFVVVYPSMLNARAQSTIGDILQSVVRKFSAMYKESSAAALDAAADFGKVYNDIVTRFEQKASRTKERKQRKFEDTKKGRERKKLNEAEQRKKDEKKKKAEAAAQKRESEAAASSPKKSKKLSMLEKLKRMRDKKGRKNTKRSPVSSGKASPPRKGKQGRKWTEELTDEEKARLDMSEDKGADGAAASEGDLAAQRDIYMPDGKIEFGPDPDDMDSSEDEAGTDGKDDGTSSGGGIFSFFQSLTGQKPLERSDLEPILEKVKQGLMDKNVAVEIAEKICESVCSALIGKTVGTFGSVSATVREAIKKSLQRILTPKRVINILPEIKNAKRAGRPYTIVFIGVNGVGKSTSLAKVCAYLQSKGLKVSIAACDTFRSGAVEQLKTHTRFLKARLYEKGYNRDAAAVAKDAIAQAKQLKEDVVLVDTAGRMQDNLPLMQALAKLVAVNRPDLVLFVGEALVGNDAVDQVRKFNQALIDHSTSATPRLIDGMILTKFDTIDDKVGAAISLSYTTGKPIIFVGTGQTYSDLKRMNAKMLIRMLLR